MKKGAKAVVTVVVLVLIAAAAAWFLLPRYLPESPLAKRLPKPPAAPAVGPRGPAGRQPEAFAVPVAVTAAVRAPARETLDLYGSVLASREVSIFTSVPGKVKQVRIREGDVVKRDQVLADIDRDQPGLKYANVEVTSTIDGVVKSVLTEVGATASPAAPLFQIVDMDVVEAAVNVPEKMISRVRPGLSAEISAVSYPNRLFYGTVSRLNPVLDPISRTLETRVRVDNPSHLLKPGMFVEVRIVLRQEREAVRIPRAALLDREGREAVFLVDGERARLVLPTVAFWEGDYAVIQSGIEAGQRVVLVGQQNLNDGDAVNVVEERK